MSIGDVFKCAHCGKSFLEEWSDEEAKAEAAENDFNVESCQKVCDDCYKEFMAGEKVIDLSELPDFDHFTELKIKFPAKYSYGVSNPHESMKAKSPLTTWEEVLLARGLLEAEVHAIESGR